MTEEKKRKRRLVPELELPALIHAALVSYVGPRRIAKLEAWQQAELIRIAKNVGSDVGAALDGVRYRGGKPGE